MAEERCLAVVGPTAAGKSEIALAIAERRGWEIVSVDSRRVYRRFDLGTAKPTAAERARVPHHLIDVVDPPERYDGARFVANAEAAVRARAVEGRRLLFEGGTGLYLRAYLTGGMDGPGRDPEVRRALEEELASRGAQALHRELARRDPTAADAIHPRDGVRIVRALEIARLTGEIPSAVLPGWRGRPARLPARVVVVTRPKAELDRRIAARFDAMVEKGLVEEVRGIVRDHGSDLPALASPGYRETAAHLAGEISWEEARERAVHATCRYAKRQLTWFRHQEPDARWLDIGNAEAARFSDQVERLLLASP
jgi:tRNA dimethylallyltransferase